MRKPNRFKSIIILFPALMLLGIVMVLTIPKGTLLKASTPEKSFVDIFKGKQSSSTPLETEDSSVEFSLQAKEAGVYKIPYDEKKILVNFVIEKNTLPYFETNSDEFHLEEGNKIAVKQNSTIEEDSGNSEEANSETEKEILKEPLEIEAYSETQTPEPRDIRDESSVYKVTDSRNNEEGSLYLKLKKGEKVSLQVENLSEEEQKVKLSNVIEAETQQTLVQFQKKQEKPKVSEQKADTGIENELPQNLFSDTSSKVELRDPKVTIRTGEKNFDPDDAPGHDSSPTNDIVRTWDKVTYSYSFSIQSTNSSKTYKDIKYRIDATLKNSRQVVDGQVRDYAYFPEGTQTGNNASTTRDATYSTTGTLATSSTIIDSAINLQVLGATHNYELLPEIKITILEATDVTTGEVIPIDITSTNLVTKSVKVSAKPNVKATFARADSAYQLMSNLTGETDLKAMAQGLGIKFSVIPLTDKGITRTGSLFEKLYGATYPNGEIKVNVTTNAYFQPEIGSKHDIIYGTDQKQPEISHYGGLVVNDPYLDRLVKTPEFDGMDFQNWALKTPWQMPASIDNNANKDRTDSVYDSNIMYANNDSVSNLSYSVTNPAAIFKEGLLGYMTPNDENKDQATFASIASILSIPYDYIEGKTGTLYTNFATTTIEYDGKETKNDSNYTHQRSNRLPGSAICYTPSWDSSSKKIGSNPVQSWTPPGDGSVYKNQAFYSIGIYDSASIEVKYQTGITAWNTNSFELDSTRKVNPYVLTSQGAPGELKELLYGVRKNKKAIPNLTVDFVDMDTSYDWYQSYEEAIKVGPIAAIKTVFEKTGLLDSTFKIRANIPLKAIGPTNNQATDEEGNANVIVSSMLTQTSSKETIRMFPTKETTNNVYTPTKYDANNKLISYPKPANLYGDTLLIVPFTTSLNKQAMKSSYNSDELVKWQLTPQVQADENDEVTFTIKDTLPKELSYVAGSTKYGSQEIEPSVEEKEDGTTLLIWSIPYSKSKNPIQKLTFDTVINGRNIQYDATNTKSVTNKATISGKNKEGLTDDTIESLRSAEASTTITKVSTVFLLKSTSTPIIESGKMDGALSNGEKNTTLSYTLYNKNEAKTPARETKILDVLPNASDGRGSTFNGTYDLLSVHTSGDVQPKIYYSTNPISSNTNPNDIDISSGWTLYSSGRANNITAIYAVYDEIGVGEDVSIDFSVATKNQKVKDTFVNVAKLDNYNNNPVESVYVKTSVIGRSLEGIAWYDDNLNGKKEADEAIAPNIPVKLYRTSHVNENYKNVLIKESLTGQKFIDESGKSLVATNAKGEYKFSNLPEGDYVVYFEIDDDVVQQKFKVTTKDTEISSQEIGTSKVDQKTYKTDSYETPTLKGGSFTDNEWKVENIDIGLIRPSTIRLFKYETGSAIDGDNDGELTEAEKAAGKPLKGAVFEIYEGNSEEPLTTETTDENGLLYFTKLFPGEYTLIETKAPEGYELNKSPIKVTIIEGNQTIKLFQEDDKITELPHAGGNNALIIGLIISASVLALAMCAVMLHFRKMKQGGED